MFADDTYITTADEEISTIECSLNSDLIAVHNWLKTNKLSCNTSNIHLCGPTLTIMMLYGVTAPKHLPTNCKSCKIEQHGLLLGLITLSDHQMY